MVTTEMLASLGELVARRSNDHDRFTTDFHARTGVAWHAPVPAAWSAGRAVSVVIAACDSAYSLPTVLDALGGQQCQAGVQVIVVDDASSDETAAIAATHPVVDVWVRLPQRCGPAMARNVGTRLAEADTVLYLDADMVLPPHVLADVAARVEPELLLVGFRHDVTWQAGMFGRALLPGGAPDLYGDHRACRHLQVGVPERDQQLVVYPIDETRDFQGLGGGVSVHGLDLARVVEARLLALPRVAVVEVGGFDPGLRTPSLEGAHLGAALIALGLVVVPLRQAVAWHVCPPDPHSAWQAKVDAWKPAADRYRQLWAAPPVARQAVTFRYQADQILGAAEVVQR